MLNSEVNVFVSFKYLCFSGRFSLIQLACAGPQIPVFGF